MQLFLWLITTTEGRNKVWGASTSCSDCWIGSAKLDACRPMCVGQTFFSFFSKICLVLCLAIIIVNTETISNQA